MKKITILVGEDSPRKANKLKRPILDRTLSVKLEKFIIVTNNIICNPIEIYLNKHLSLKKAEPHR